MVSPFAMKLPNPLKLSILALCALATLPLRADDKPDKNAPHPNAEAPKETPRPAPTPTPPLSVSEHTATVSGKPLKYKVTAGYLTLKEETEKQPGKEGEGKGDGEANKDNLKPTAKVFYIAYTVEGFEASARPITYAFNGGPGAASVWLHMGALGPRRIKLDEMGDGTPPPNKIVDNDYSWLDQTDLVFIDPVSTGYSRPVPGESARSFHGYNEDLQSVAEFIRLYTTQNNRWLSPKLVVGESYGGLRAAAIAGYLQERCDLTLNGVIIVSGVLSWQTIAPQPGNDLPYSLYLPSYAASAWYHKKLSPELQAMSEEQVRKSAEIFAGGDYLLALSKGNSLSDDDRKKVADRYAKLTGLPVDLVLRHHLRVPPGRFMDELLKVERRSIGRFDSRLTGLAYEADGADFDPSFELLHSSFTAGINAYLRSELKFETDLPYRSLANVSPWNYGNAENRFLDVSDSLAHAMTRNPHLKVWVISGYYDLAVPYFATDYALRQMELDPSVLKNVRFSKYEGGHMLYTQEPLLKQFTADFDEFIGSLGLKN